jgi:hypothetical protein
MSTNGAPVSSGLFDEFERRIDGELERLTRETADLRQQLGERRSRTWTLGLAILAGVVLPILGALIAAVIQFGT